ncbi:tol-pal system protein YbgF [Mesobaculum littorinae]|uniref:Cell division coordinator CpoB n=1 Tax=Mesobaculum littorinae TaxID=2486419 RepID=A0A438AID0_9RHOB|nr:tol-pal system protein YbgF [Mesobaculum littorinae]RVV98503.1 tol-pal system protein YbgF [Mesobaculum littorinae]
MIRHLPKAALILSLGLAAVPVAPVPEAQAQTEASDETLADIRQELQVLYVEVQRLKRELSTTGAPDMNLQGTSVLDRVDRMEAELSRLTGEAEEMQYRIDRVVSDGTNKIGDLEFRLCELEEGCDIGSLGDTPTLGGDAGAAPAPTAAPAPATPPAGSGGGAELAMSEQADFDRAKEALDSGDFQGAADLFASFTTTYTGGPLTGDAHYYRGEALSKLGNTSDAARAYLESFSGAPNGPRAPRALLNLGLALDQLDQRPDACVTLGEVSNRFPQSDASVEAQTARANMGCS